MEDLGRWFKHHKWWLQPRGRTLANEERGQRLREIARAADELHRTQPGIKREQFCAAVGTLAGNILQDKPLSARAVFRAFRKMRDMPQYRDRQWVAAPRSARTGTGKGENVGIRIAARIVNKKTLLC